MNKAQYATYLKSSHWQLFRERVVLRAFVNGKYKCETYVEIVKTDSGEVVKRIGPCNKRKAELIEDGANINLNHSEYFTRIVDE